MLRKCVARLWVPGILLSLVACGGGGGGGGNGGGPASHPLDVACAGSICSGQYSGSGVGVWQYQNSGSTDTTFDLKVAGVSGGKQVNLVFTNGLDTPAGSLPSAGTTASPDRMAAVSNSLPTRPSFMAGHDDSHARVLALNAQTAQLLRGLAGRNPLADLQNAQTAAVQATPALGATRSWRETAFTGNTYASTNRSVCALSSGRKVVFWQDNNDAALTISILGQFTDAVCGNGKGKGFDKLTALIGDAWGSHSDPRVIPESAGAKQDINIVFLNAPADATWAGYFMRRNNAMNTFLSRIGQTPDSNQALVFFVNTNGIAQDVNFYISTLIHEAKHMISFYQEDLLRGKAVDVWYQETSAMMAEDIVAAGITGSNKIARYRIPDYIRTGGHVSLNNWGDLSPEHYAMGGALGAFLNRRYGVDLWVDSITGSRCTTGAAKTDSYACLDTLIRAANGKGIADELARMGASVFSTPGTTGLPSGYGFPQVLSRGYTLSAVDLSGFTPGNAADLSTYTSMTHHPVRETVGAGVTQWGRNRVTVPAGTTLHLIVQ